MTAAVTGLHTCTGSEETTGVTTITGEGLILNFCGPVRGWGVLTPGIFCCRAPTLLITNCVNTPPGEGRAAANKNLQVKNLQFSYFILLVTVFYQHLLCTTGSISYRYYLPAWYVPISTQRNETLLPTQTKPL